MADVHGAYDALVSLLKTTQLIDDKLAWSGGRATLVVVGDVLDRGSGSRRVLELLMRLEREASAAGGRSQLVLGNHEIMNLTGELDYVASEDYAAYAAEESAAERFGGARAVPRGARERGRRRRARGRLRAPLSSRLLRAARGICERAASSARGCCANPF